MNGESVDRITKSKILNLKISESMWIALILISTVVILLISIYCLSHNITIIFMHLYYFPIIFLAYHYRYRGFILAIFLSSLYIGLVYLYQQGQTDVISGAWYRFFVFIGIAATIAILSDRLYDYQQDLVKSSKKYLHLFENMMEGYAYCQMVYDHNGMPVDWIYLKVNPAFEQLTGLKDIIGKRVLEAIPNIKELTPELFDIYHRVAFSGKSETFEVDFKPLKMWLKISVFCPEKGYFIAVFEDVTERKVIEDALRASEKRYRDLFEMNNAVMLIIDPGNGSIIDGNDAASRFYGYSRKELQTLTIAKINIADPEHIRKDMAYAANSRGAVFHFQHRKKNGEICDVQVFSAPIMLGSQKLLHSIIQDITKRIQTEEALKQSNKKLNLLSSITRHDINNQLTLLKAFLDLSKSSLDNPIRLSEYLIKEERVVNTIERQIAFTKEYQDLGVKEPIWQKVDSCINTAVSSLPIRDIQVKNDSKKIEILADPLFEKVFYNLIDNALRYGGDQMTTITISSRETNSGIIITVEDDGEGITVKDKQRVFERGFGHNTGLGLFLSREILAITGITITESGEPGMGARFEISIPKDEYRFQEPRE